MTKVLMNQILIGFLAVSAQADTIVLSPGTSYKIGDTTVSCDSSASSSDCGQITKAYQEAMDSCLLISASYNREACIPSTWFSYKSSSPGCAPVFYPKCLDYCKSVSASYRREECISESCKL